MFMDDENVLKEVFRVCGECTVDVENAKKLLFGNFQTMGTACSEEDECILNENTAMADVCEFRLVNFLLCTGSWVHSKYFPT